MESDPDRNGDLSAGTKRIQEALARRGGVSWVAEGEPPRDRSGSRAIAKAMRRHLKEERKKRRDLARGEDGLPQAIVFGGASLLLLGMAIRQPGLWWMVFPAFGFAMAAAGILTKWARRHREESPARSGVEVTIVPPPSRMVPPKVESFPGAAAIATRQDRVVEICDRLLSDLKSAPQVVRELMRKPDETVEALRAASAELARRERELRRALTETGEERLQAERTALEARVSAERDEVVREGLSSALEALDAQLAQRKELSRAAARIEAEGTRILYSLESLRARVLRVRAADATGTGSAGEGLREGLEQLSREMDAVATALEEVHAAGTVRRQMPIPQATGG